MRDSTDWLAYFQRNARKLLDIPWQNGPELCPYERDAIASSIRGFQRGESSEGHHLLECARRYADAADDPDYLSAIKLFIAEEQRHARDLGRFLSINGIPLAKANFPDRVFRFLRRATGTLEISVAVLITAELIALVYYTALRRATRSGVLRVLCDQILRDELAHVGFQAQQLGKLRARRGRLAYLLTSTAQRTLFLGTCVVVWVFHGRALRAGECGFARYWRHAWTEFARAFSVSEAVRHEYRSARKLRAATRAGSPTSGVNPAS